MNPACREHIIETINNLIDARELIFEQIVNLSMSNEYEYLQEVFEEGDHYEFSLNHFENMEDVNVQKLVRLCKLNEETVFTIMDLNGINECEVNLNND